MLGVAAAPALLFFILLFSNSSITTLLGGTRHRRRSYRGTASDGQFESNQLSRINAILYYIHSIFAEAAFKSDLGRSPSYRYRRGKSDLHNGWGVGD